MRFVLLTIGLVLEMISLYAQLPQWGGQLHYGFIAPHNKQMIHLITGHSYGMQVYAQWPTQGNKAWHLDYRLPAHRLDYMVLNTGNLYQLGYQHALTYQLHLPLDRKRRRNYLNMGLGPAYATKKWDIQTNRQGHAIGSHFNAALILNYEWLLWKQQTEWSLGLRLTHLSNGAFSMPNAGTNNLSVHCGVNFGRQRTVAARTSTVAPQDSIDRWIWGIYAVVGFKEIQPPLSRKYPVIALQSAWLYQANRKSAFMVQADLIANTSNAAIATKAREDRKPQQTQPQLGIALGYQLRFGAMGFFIQQGIYVIDPYRYDGTLYNRFGLRSYGQGPWMFHIGLKTHFAKADHGELGVGYIIGRRGKITRGVQS